MCEELISSSWEKNHMSNFSYTISIGQLGEQLTLNQRAQGSSPWKCTRYPLSREIWTVDFSYQKTHNILQLDRSEPVML